MGLAIGGETAHALREQAARISACSLKFFWEDSGADGFERGAIVRSGLRFHAEDSAQGSLWEDRVVLDEAFYAAPRDHPVPLLEAAISYGTVARHLCLACVATAPARQGHPHFRG